MINPVTRVVAARVRVAPHARVPAADTEPGHRALRVLPRQPGGQAMILGQVPISEQPVPNRDTARSGMRPRQPGICAGWRGRP